MTSNTHNEAICAICKMTEEIARLNRIIDNAMREFNKHVDCPRCLYDEADDYLGFRDDCLCTENQLLECWRKWLQREVKDAADM